MNRCFAILPVVIVLTACSGIQNKPIFDDAKAKLELPNGHIQVDDIQASGSVLSSGEESIPAPVRIVPSLPTPNTLENEVTHTVVVFDVPVRELLFSLARDAGLELDMDANITQLVTMNAVAQPLDVLLERLADSAGLNYEVRKNVLRIRRDTPYLESYALNFLNMSRISTGSVGVSTQIQATGQGSSDGGGSESGGNNSDTSVTTLSQHNFWDSLTEKANRYNFKLKK